MDTRKLRMEETEHGFAIHDIDTDNEDCIGYVELTGDSAYDEQERFPLAIEIVRRWNTFPEAIAIIQEVRKLTSNSGSFSGEATDDDGGFVYSDPLTKRIEAFIRSIPTE